MSVHLASQGVTGFVFYLTLDVVETNCSVISKKDWKTCKAREVSDTPVRFLMFLHFYFAFIAST